MVDVEVAEVEVGAASGAVSFLLTVECVFVVFWPDDDARPDGDVGAVVEIVLFSHLTPIRSHFPIISLIGRF